MIKSYLISDSAPTLGHNGRLCIIESRYWTWWLNITLFLWPSSTFSFLLSHQEKHRTSESIDAWSPWKLAFLSSTNKLLWDIISSHLANWTASSLTDVTIWLYPEWLVPYGIAYKVNLCSKNPFPYIVSSLPSNQDDLITHIPKRDRPNIPP